MAQARDKENQAAKKLADLKAQADTEPQGQAESHPQPEKEDSEAYAKRRMAHLQQSFPDGLDIGAEEQAKMHNQFKVNFEAAIRQKAAEQVGPADKGGAMDLEEDEVTEMAQAVAAKLRKGDNEDDKANAARKQLYCEQFKQKFGGTKHKATDQEGKGRRGRC